MKIILVLYGLFTTGDYYYFITYKPDFLGNIAGLFFVILSFITLLIACVIDFRKNKGLKKRNRYFITLFFINLASMSLAILLGLVLDKGMAEIFVSSLGRLWGEGMGSILTTPIIAYIVGLVGDHTVKNRTSTPQ